MTERDNGSIIERGPGFREGLRDLPAAINLNSVSAGTVAAIFGCSGPALIVIGAAAAGKLTSGQTVAWLLAIYGLGGLISLLLALRYKMPINGAYSIPGAAIMTAAFASFSFPEIVGAFIMSGAIVLLLGVTGVIRRIMHWLPMPIVMAMIVGAMIRFGVGAVDSVKAAPIIAGSAALAFFLTMRFIKTFPPVLAALIVGLFAAAATGSIQAATVDIAFVAPEFTVPVFTMAAFFGVAVPLAALVIGAENAQATGVLMAEGYKPPVNAMTIVSGIGGILAGCMGGHNANIAGPMTAICSSEQAGEDRSKRYGATVVNGLLFGAFGLLAGVAVPFVLALPRPLIAVVAGLAMIGVLLSALQHGFAKQQGHQVGAFVALLVAMSSLNLFGISAPFWALVFGVIVSLLADRAVVPALKRQGESAGCTNA
ncbi:benzoate/H(+) symporter BenE family transporter [Burkholderia cenocepacia]|uniref:benzoate/H(+) symporter BenE family transporter n=1 Tax=Burkholderia cenocepacia TaxID=95486 RepID=UPI001B992B67|nr:benzoate/H(+) symporter BenE family transporter [Burkholderia cenocepacia]MBR8159292.1 benzoate/H(+) symporter BenE family transporter [Burkholderia cenocepacia]